MRINHHIGVSIEPKTTAAFAQIGIDLGQYQRDKFHSSAVFDIFEDDPRWPGVQNLKKQMPFLDVVWTVFTEEERSNARFCSMGRTWDNGYPKPDGRHEYEDPTYPGATYASKLCPQCGTGRIQSAPFRLTGEPKWGSRSLMCLNWVPDELFTTPEVWKTVFEPFGVSCRPALKHRTGQPLESCVQLVIDQTVEVAIPADHPSTPCPVCGVKRWDIFRRGFYPKPCQPSEAHLFKSLQYFGTGHLSYKHIIASAALSKEIFRLKLRGCQFEPCAD